MLRLQPSENSGGGRRRSRVAENDTAMAAEDVAATAAKDRPRRRPWMAPRRWLKWAATAVVDGVTTTAEERAATAAEGDRDGGQERSKKLAAELRNPNLLCYHVTNLNPEMIRPNPGVDYIDR
jgi:hypothetical protein